MILETIHPFPFRELGATKLICESTFPDYRQSIASMINHIITNVSALFALARGKWYTLYIRSNMCCFLGSLDKLFQEWYIIPGILRYLIFCMENRSQNESGWDEWHEYNLMFEGNPLILNEQYRTYRRGSCSYQICVDTGQAARVIRYFNNDCLQSNLRRNLQLIICCSKLS